MKKLTALLLALVMCLGLTACGGTDTQPAIDAFNTAADAFDMTANAINEDVEAYPQELIDTMNEMADAMLEAKALLESDTELTEEKVQELVSDLADVEAWAVDVYENLENMTVEATTVDTSKEAVIESFNYVVERFDAISIEVNKNIDAYEEEFIEGMTEIAEGILSYKEILESEAELSEEDAMSILEGLLLVDEWIDSLEEG